LSANARSIRSAPAAPIKETPSALIFVRLAHDRRFVGAVLFLFLFVLVSSSSSGSRGGIVLPMITK
jgi:hypothetical protein